jgi:hypothetical protein
MQDLLMGVHAAIVALVDDNEPPEELANWPTDGTCATNNHDLVLEQHKPSFRTQSFAIHVALCTPLYRLRHICL